MRPWPLTWPGPPAPQSHKGLLAEGFRRAQGEVTVRLARGGRMVNGVVKEGNMHEKFNRFGGVLVDAFHYLAPFALAGLVGTPYGPT